MEEVETQVIQKGIYHDVEYRITQTTISTPNIPTFPKPYLRFFCAYIKLTDKYAVKNWKAIVGGELLVHGGVNFIKNITTDNTQPQQFTPGYWVGWDYAHAFDGFINRKEFQTAEDHHWTEEKVFAEIKDVVDEQILNSQTLRQSD